VKLIRRIICTVGQKVARIFCAGTLTYDSLEFASLLCAKSCLFSKIIGRCSPLFSFNLSITSSFAFDACFDRLLGVLRQHSNPCNLPEIDDKLNCIT